MVAESTRKRGERREGSRKVCGRKKVRLMARVRARAREVRMETRRVRGRM